jgi:predicted dienelactone hydrolase
MRWPPMRASRPCSTSSAWATTVLDVQRVGHEGMSAGGLPSVSLAGAQWSPSRLAAHCDAHIADDFSSCVGLATELTGDAFDGLKLAVARRVVDWKFGNETTPQGWNEPRIAAVVAAVPMAVPIDMASLAQPRVPLGLVRAGKDAWLAPRWHIDAVRAVCKSCTLLADMAGGGHGSILSPQVPDLPPRAARLLNDPPGFDRAAVPLAYAAITRFFVQNLAP